MKKVSQYFSMYKGLKKEIYVLAFGRVMTSMGSLVWPMFTLILKNKLGFDATSIGMYMMIMSLIMIPCNLLGGKLADHFNKKHIIVFFDFISVFGYILCGLLPLSIFTILVFALASIFQQMEAPSYDSLIADLTNSNDREKAYSLSYLSMNLGLVLAPTIGGILFNNYLNLAFVINGLSILSSTLLIFFFVKDIKIKNDSSHINQYEQSEKGSLYHVMTKRKLLIFYFLLASISGIIYAQFNFLIPLHLEAIFLSEGAFYFGILTSVNALVVILGTPQITRLFSKWNDVDCLILGNFLEVISLGLYVFIFDQFYLCIISMIFFTFGEILCTISSTPYLTKRIPDTHRGRILSIQGITYMIIGSIGNMAIGKLVDMFNITFVWWVVLIVGILSLIGYAIYRKFDYIKYKLLYN